MLWKTPKDVQNGFLIFLTRPVKLIFLRSADAPKGNRMK